MLSGLLQPTGQYERVLPAWKCYPILWFLRNEMKQKLDAESMRLEALSCQKQVVAGTNYKIVVRYFQNICFILFQNVCFGFT